MNPGAFTQIDVSVVNDTQGKLGRSRARNLVAKESTADWLFFLDADDLMHPEAFESVSPYLGLYDGIWGNIWEYSNGVCVWRYQVPRLSTYKELIDHDPYLTLQMGHFVKKDCFIPFDEDMDAGEDFKYYLAMWKQHNCVKVDECFFLNQRGMHSTGNRSMSGGDWSRIVGELMAQARSE